jgi:hypothetical protein
MEADIERCGKDMAEQNGYPTDMNELRKQWYAFLPIETRRFFGNLFGPRRRAYELVVGRLIIAIQRGSRRL